MKVYDAGFMQQAIAIAQTAVQKDEVPVGAVLVHDGQVIASNFNQPISLSDPSAHAEMLVLREAGEKLGNYRLKDTTLYVTLEPCPMCVGAMIHARVKRCVFGAHDPKTGAMGSAIDLPKLHAWNHVLEYEGGVMAEPCSQLLKDFFQKRR